MGHPLIMGRKTFEAIGKPLDGRDSIVVSRSNPNLALNPHVFSAASLEEALTTARELAKARGVKEAFVIGGSRAVQSGSPTREPDLSDARARVPEGDVHWEPPLSNDWIEIRRKEYPASDRDEFPVTDVILSAERELDGAPLVPYAGTHREAGLS